MLRSGIAPMRPQDGNVSHRVERSMDKAVEIKSELIRQAMEITGAASEREAIERAVASFVAQHRKRRLRKNMFDLVGKVRLREDYDHKALRKQVNPHEA
jgi:hypothetical protein